MKASLVAGASSGGISGGIQGTYGYYSGPGPHTATGALGASAQGTVFGAATGGAGGAVGQKISQKLMATVTVRPDAGTMAMGRSMTQRVTPYADSHGMGYYKALPDKFYAFTDASVAKWARQHPPLGEQEMDRLSNDARKVSCRYRRAGGAPPPGVPVMGSSPYYNMELERVSGYPRYSQDPQPSWNLGESHGISGEVLQGS